MNQLIKRSRFQYSNLETTSISTYCCLNTSFILFITSWCIKGCRCEYTFIVIAIVLRPRSPALPSDTHPLQAVYLQHVVCRNTWIWLTLGKSSSAIRKKRGCLCSERISFRSNKADHLPTLCLGHLASPKVRQTHFGRHLPNRINTMEIRPKNSRPTVRFPSTEAILLLGGPGRGQISIAPVKPAHLPSPHANSPLRPLPLHS